MKIDISLSDQVLMLRDAADQLRATYRVSTALNGPGERRDSGCTPRGQHVVRAKIGEGQPLHTVFLGRRPTGELWTPELDAQKPHQDWILTRILWLSGCEPGFNRLGDCDTMQRYIYIHGAPDSAPMGVPGSHGCIRMRGSDILVLFAQVPVGTRVLISE